MDTYINGSSAVEFEQLTLVRDVTEKKELLQANSKRASLLRERAVNDGTFETMEDKDVLAVIIGAARGGCDPYLLADNLLDTFGSLKGVLEARAEQLRMIRGMNESRVQQLSLIKPIVRLWNRVQNEKKEEIHNTRDAEYFCKALLAGERMEKFYVTALNAQCHVLGRRCISVGSLNEVSAYPRMVMETALNYNAYSVLLCHNHPGGTCAPSVDDISSTVTLQRLLKGVGIFVLDHIIVANDKTYSMIQHGDIDYRIK